MHATGCQDGSGPTWTKGTRTISGHRTYRSKDDPDITVDWQWHLAASG